MKSINKIQRIIYRLNWDFLFISIYLLFLQVYLSGTTRTLHTWNVIPRAIYGNYIVKLCKQKPSRKKSEQLMWLPVSIYSRRKCTSNRFLSLRGIVISVQTISPCRKQITPWNRKIPCSYEQLARNERHYLLTNNFSRRPFAKKTEGDVAVGLRKSRKSCIAQGIQERGTRVVRHFSASMWVSETILLLKAAPTASREICARREMADRTATEERLIKRAKTVFIKFICGNMRRLK